MHIAVIAHCGGSGGGVQRLANRTDTQLLPLGSSGANKQASSLASAMNAVVGRCSPDPSKITVLSVAHYRGPRIIVLLSRSPQVTTSWVSWQAAGAHTRRHSHPYTRSFTQSVAPIHAVLVGIFSSKLPWKSSHISAY